MTAKDRAAFIVGLFLISCMVGLTLLLFGAVVAMWRVAFS